ncbi:UDP-N-acetylmuramoyl-tripeptide--D-alanyl-D-alanine ligase [Bdellovibrio sp. HCB337]|uniref:UDP-N-acetylmuramoyl-tripeptide--D-alanyl-D- alanine ligase n=1 Tax=Bdellovibrio sp. HCB337 TaxID=3394358 RepID=UPI0039A675FD
MRIMELKDVLAATKGQALSDVNQKFQGIGTDTRQSLQGQLFIALKGESFDAHNFVDKAVAQGAAGILVHEKTPMIESLKSKTTVILVSDTLKALQNLGNWARKTSKATIIGITGSNGKTTTKEFTAAVIDSFKSVHYSKGSFNNHWGVPFTLLQLDPQKEVAVVEMGMNHAGEITELVHIAEPDVVCCTMVGRAHIEHFGTIEKIAEAKEEIYEAASPTATRVYNLDNPLTHKMYEKAQKKFPQAKLVTFSSTDPKADVYLKLDAMGLQSLTVSGHILDEDGTVTVPVFGAQNLTNLMAAAAIGIATGLDPEQVWQGLGHCKTIWGRNQLLDLKSGAQMIFDGYNANPDSMKALLDNVKILSTKGRKIGVFGEMLEMGSLANSLHEELGELVGKSGFDKVYFIGASFGAFEKGLKKSGYKNPANIAGDFKDETAREFAGDLRSGDMAMVKGSRGMKLERFVLPCEPKDFSLNK